MNTVRLIPAKDTLSSEETFDALIGAFTPIGDLSSQNFSMAIMKCMSLMKIQVCFSSFHKPEKDHQAHGEVRVFVTRNVRRLERLLYLSRTLQVFQLI